MFRSCNYSARNVCCIVNLPRISFLALISCNEATTTTTKTLRIAVQNLKFLAKNQE